MSAPCRMCSRRTRPMKYPQGIPRRGHASAVWQRAPSQRQHPPPCQRHARGYSGRTSVHEAHQWAVAPGCIRDVVYAAGAVLVHTKSDDALARSRTGSSKDGDVLHQAHTQVLHRPHEHTQSCRPGHSSERYAYHQWWQSPTHKSGRRVEQRPEVERLRAREQQPTPRPR